MPIRTMDDLDVRDKRVMVRADLNVPLDGSRITDDGKIRACLPTLNTLLDRGAAVLICSHLGRPAGVPDPAYSLAPVAIRLGELLSRPVTMAADTVGPSARAPCDPSPGAAAAWSTTGTKVSPSRAKRHLASGAGTAIVDLVSNLPGRHE
jgi:3-phosphoglycerate kinase